MPMFEVRSYEPEAAESIDLRAASGTITSFAALQHHVRCSG